MSLPLKVNRVDREPISSVRMVCRSDHYRNDELTVMESVSCCCSLPVKDREGRGEERRGEERGESTGEDCNATDSFLGLQSRDGVDVDVVVRQKRRVGEWK